MAVEIPGGRVSVPDALLGTERGEQHLSLPPDKGAEAAKGRQRRVRGERLHAEDVAVVPAGVVRPRRGLGPPARGRARAFGARRAGGRAQVPAPPVILLPVREHRAERAPGLPDDGVRGRLPERRGGRRGVHVRVVREVYGQRLDRHGTSVSEHGRRLLAEPGVGHAVQVVPGAGDHGPEAPEVRLFEKTSGIHRRSFQRDVGHQALRKHHSTAIKQIYCDVTYSEPFNCVWYTAVAFIRTLGSCIEG